MACQKHGTRFSRVCRWCDQARNDAERLAAQHALRREKRERQARLQKARRLAERDARRLRKLDAARQDLDATLTRHPDRPLGPDLIAVLREIVREFRGR